MKKKIEYKGVSIPNRKGVGPHHIRMWKAIIDNPKMSHSEFVNKHKADVFDSTFYTVRKKVLKLVKQEPTTKNISISNAIRDELARNPDMNHKQFEKTSGRKVTSAHYSTVRQQYLRGENLPTVNYRTSKFKKGTNEILEVIDLNDYENQESTIMEVLREKVIPAISRRANLKLDVVRMLDPNVIELRSFNR